MIERYLPCQDFFTACNHQPSCRHLAQGCGGQNAWVVGIKLSSQGFAPHGAAKHALHMYQLAVEHERSETTMHAASCGRVNCGATPPATCAFSKSPGRTRGEDAAGPREQRARTFKLQVAMQPKPNEHCGNLWPASPVSEGCCFQNDPAIQGGSLQKHWCKRATPAQAAQRQEPVGHRLGPHNASVKGGSLRPVPGLFSWRDQHSKRPRRRPPPADAAVKCTGLVNVAMPKRQRIKDLLGKLLFWRLSTCALGLRWCSLFEDAFPPGGCNKDRFSECKHQ